jgi:hypothetical protein
LRPLGQEKKQGQTHKVDPANWTVLCGGNWATHYIVKARQNAHKGTSSEEVTWSSLHLRMIKTGWWNGSSGKNACLASMRPQVQTPMPLKKKKGREW